MCESLPIRMKTRGPIMIQRNRIYMDTRHSKFSIALYLRWPLILSVLLVLLNLVLFATEPRAAGVMLLFTFIFVAAAVLVYLYSRKGLYSGLIDFAKGYGGAESRLLNDMGTPAAICSPEGDILWANRAFHEAFDTGRRSGHITGVFPDVTGEVLGSLQETGLIHTSYRGQRYLVEMCPSRLAEGPDDPAVIMAEKSPEAAESSGILAECGREIVAISVIDETELVHYRGLYEDNRPCEGLIYVDNYDEAMASVEEVRRSLLTALVDRRISNYISSVGGVVKKLEKDKYFFFVTERSMQQMEADRFAILEEVKTINIGNETALTLSIGIGRDGENYQTNYESARTAIDLALGRGGDQAVIKSGDNVSYFGGKTQAKEKNARVKARVKAQALKELMNSGDKFIIMGHKNSDVDALGAAIGCWRIATSYGKKAHIVLNTVTKSLEPLYKAFANNPDYPNDMFVSGDQAMELLDRQTIVMVVDVNRPSYTEEPGLLQKAGSVVVIDHHRKGTESVENATLSYVEPYASSACEMVAEIIQYIGSDIRLLPLEADAMYGGMVIDTQNFINQTGVRTFEAAAFLKRQGASIPKIRKMFRDSFNDYRAKAEAIGRSFVYREHFALSELDPEGVDSPTIVGAQAANSLLEIDGIRAAFVLTPYSGQIFISARSIDDINVQVMMEKLGGGGHMSMAGAQLKDVTMEEAFDKVKELIDQMLEEG